MVLTSVLLRQQLELQYFLDSKQQLKLFSVPALPLAMLYATAQKGGRERKDCALLELYSTCAMQGEEQVSWVKSSLQAELSVSLA